MEPIQAFRTIEIPLDLGDGEMLYIKVPFTVDLLRQVEETLMKANTRVWFRLNKRDQSTIDAFEEFCRPYFPKEFDFSQKQPTLSAVFFSRVRDELTLSIDGCMASAKPTDE